MGSIRSGGNLLSPQVNTIYQQEGEVYLLRNSYSNRMKLSIYIL